MPVLDSDPMYVLAISINPGAPLGGSITQYFPGSFNGTHFEAVDGAARLTDFGKDNYAGQFFYGIPETEDQVFIAWASNWQYSQTVPTGETEGWRSAMSVPRKNYLANIAPTGWTMVSAPYDMSPVLDTQLASNSSLGNSSVLLDYSSVPSGALYFQINSSSISAGSINFTFSSSLTQESVSGGIFLTAGDFWLSRRNINGFAETNPFFTDKFSVNNPVNNKTFTLEGIIDRSILEVFLDGGRNSAIATFYPEGELDTLRVSANGITEGASVSVGVWALKDAWAAMSSGDGIVYGNVTQAAKGR